MRIAFLRSRLRLSSKLARGSKKTAHPADEQHVVETEPEQNEHAVVSEQQEQPGPTQCVSAFQPGTVTLQLAPRRSILSTVAT